VILVALDYLRPVESSAGTPAVDADDGVTGLDSVGVEA
jgi:hypothetical protein